MSPPPYVTIVPSCSASQSSTLYGNHRPPYASPTFAPPTKSSITIVYWCDCVSILNSTYLMLYCVLYPVNFLLHSGRVLVCQVRHDLRLALVHQQHTVVHLHSSDHATDHC